MDDRHTTTANLEGAMPHQRVASPPRYRPSSPYHSHPYHSKARRLPCFTPFTVKGFLVGIKKVLTYEVDLFLDQQQEQLLSSAQTTPYPYYHYSPEQLRDPDLTHPSELPVTMGRSFTCRLKSINFSHHEIPIWKVNWLTIFAKQLTDRGNGWLLCTVHNIDQYQRLIVELELVTTEGTLSVKEQLLTFTQEQTPYHGLLV